MYRAASPANQTASGDGERIPTPRIPQQIFHCVRSNAAEFARNGIQFIHAWRQLNPEFDYHLFEEQDCTSFVNRVASPAERWAYHSLATGSARADLFRVLVLLHLGGVYSDVDVQLRRPLRTIVPPDASLVLSPRIATELLLAEPHHPVFKVLAAGIVSKVREQTLLWQKDSVDPRRCIGAVQCVIDVTGPGRFKPLLYAASQQLGCNVSRYYPHVRGCDAGTRIHICRDEQLRQTTHFEKRGWDCGVAVHRNCASGRGRCSQADRDRNRRHHYANATVFFRVAQEEPHPIASF